MREPSNVVMVRGLQSTPSSVPAACTAYPSRPWGVLRAGGVDPHPEAVGSQGRERALSPCRPRLGKTGFSDHKPPATGPRLVGKIRCHFRAPSGAVSLWRQQWRPGGIMSGIPSGRVGSKKARRIMRASRTVTKCHPKQSQRSLGSNRADPGPGCPRCRRCRPEGCPSKSLQGNECSTRVADATRTHQSVSPHTPTC